MARIDIVVFPNGGREILGQVEPVAADILMPKVADFVAGLETSTRPRKFTAYYDAADAGDIAWQPYDEDNPIVMVPVESETVEPTGDSFPVAEFYQAMELAQVPAEQREKYLQ